MPDEQHQDETGQERPPPASGPYDQPYGQPSPPPGDQPPPYPPPGYGQPPPYPPPGYGQQPPPPPYTRGYGYGAAPPAPAWVDQMPYAGYGARLGGYLLDLIIVGAVSAVILLPTHAMSATTTNASGVHGAHFQVNGTGIVIGALISIGYGALLIGLAGGQTLGMRVTRVRAVSDDGRTPLSFGRALGRAAFAWVLGILVIPLIVDLLWPLWDSRNQTLHDKVVNGVVLKQPR